MNRHIVFCLCPGAPLFCIASALEVLRHANRFTDGEAYRWTFLCENDQPVQEGNGLWLYPGNTIDEVEPPDFAFIIAGIDAARLRQPQLCAWLSRQTAAGCSIGGISNGAFLLAASGLLDGYNATTHWEDFESFCILFPQVRARYQRFVIDRRRLTCSGGSATLDMLIEIVRQDLGHETGLKISRQMLLQEQTLVLPGSPLGQPSTGHYSAQLRQALGLIEAGVGQTLNVAELARRIGIGRRELLRLFKRELDETPSAMLAQRRLERARSLILNTRLPIAIIATSVGFSSQSHLTTNYRSRFGVTPAQQRRDYRNASNRLPIAGRDIRDW